MSATALLVAGGILVVVGGLIAGVIWLARRSGARAERDKQRDETLETIERIQKAGREADAEIAEDLGRPDYRKRLIDRVRKSVGQK